MEGVDLCEICGAVGSWRQDQRQWLCLHCWAHPSSRARNIEVTKKLSDALGVDLFRPKRKDDEHG